MDKGLYKGLLVLLVTIFYNCKVSTADFEWCDRDSCRDAQDILDREEEKANEIPDHPATSVFCRMSKFSSSSPRIKDISKLSLLNILKLQKCREKYPKLSCEDFWKSIDDEEICDNLLDLEDHCPFTANCKAHDDKFRTIDGSCNNKKSPLTGQAGRSYQRLLPADYFDCVNEPRNVPGGLPSARTISNKIYQSDILPNSSILNVMHMTYGQIIDHDTDVTPVSKLRNRDGDLVDVECGESGCKTEGKENRNCFPIDIPKKDPLFTDQECLKLVRAEAVPTDECSPSPRQQINDINSWLDAAFVYDNEDDKAAELRTFKDGKLRSMKHPFNSQFFPLLPTQEDSACMGTGGKIQCFRAGDRRQNEAVGLQAIHTIFMRYHNYIADKLKKKHKKWNDEELYQQARRILGAVYQMTVYNEYLPPVLGTEFMKAFQLNPKKKGYFKGYNDNTAEINPDTANGFATAAFRFGHSQIGDRLRFSDPSLKHQEDVFFSEVLFNPTRIFKSGILGNSISGVNAVTIGQTDQPAGQTDCTFSTQIAGRLFNDMPPMGPGTDLPAINTQRGRDHGLPGYTKWRAWCNDVLEDFGLHDYKMKIPKSFDDLSDNMEQSKINRLKKVYDHVDDIDLFTGGVLENQILGGQVGATFACIIAKDFHNKKFGDRYYFETNDKDIRFTKAQLKNIREQTVSAIFCVTLEDEPGNPDKELNFQKFALLQTYHDAVRALDATDLSKEEKKAKLAVFKDDANKRQPCSKLPKLDCDLF